jgi:hypothetical protein
VLEAVDREDGRSGTCAGHIERDGRSRFSQGGSAVLKFLLDGSAVYVSVGVAREPFVGARDARGDDSPAHAKSLPLHCSSHTSKLRRASDQPSRCGYRGSAGRRGPER